MTDLEKARQLLAAEGFTCVLCRGEQTFTSTRRGVAPLLALLDSGEDLSGFSAADKVVGKATAMLYRRLGVKQVWGSVMSEAAIAALAAGGIEAAWEQRVDHIVDRAGTGRCPMETATAAIDDPRLAEEAIRAKLKQLQG